MEVSIIIILALLAIYLGVRLGIKNTENKVLSKQAEYASVTLKTEQDKNWKLNTDIKDLESTKKRNLDTINSKDGSINDLNTRLNNKTTEFNALNSRYNALVTKEDTASAEVRKLNISMVEKNKEITSLKEKLDVQVKAVNRLEDSIENSAADKTGIATKGKRIVVKKK